MNNPRKRLLTTLLRLSPLVFSPSVIAQPLKQPPVSDLPILGKPSVLAANHTGLISPTPGVTHLLSGSLSPQQLTPTEARQRLAQVAAAWFNQWGNANVVLQGNFVTKPRLSLESSLLLPLYPTHQQLFLIQPGVQHHQKQTTYNLGFGGRYWPADESYWWGSYLFYDYCLQGSHHRLGIGGECQTERYRLSVNGYLPLSRWRQVNQQPWERRAARGFDLRLQRQLWQQPCLSLNTGLEHYWGQSLVSLDSAKPLLRPTALTLGLNYIPVPLVTASYGCQWAIGGKFSHQYRLQLTYRLGVPLAQQIDPGLVAVANTPATNRLAVIQRRSQIVLAQRARPVNTLVAPPKPIKDTIQLTIPANAQGSDSNKMTVKVTEKKLEGQAQSAADCPKDNSNNRNLNAKIQDPLVNGLTANNSSTAKPTKILSSITKAEDFMDNIYLTKNNYKIVPDYAKLLEKHVETKRGGEGFKTFDEMITVFKDKTYIQDLKDSNKVSIIEG